MGEPAGISLNRFGQSLSEEHWKRFDCYARGSKAVRGVVSCTQDCAAKSIEGIAVWSSDAQGRMQLHMSSADTPAFGATVLFEGAALKQLLESHNIEERAQQQGTLSCT